MYRSSPQHLTLASHEGTRVLSSETGRNLRKVASTATTRTQGTKTGWRHRASRVRVPDPPRRRRITAEGARRKSIAHKVCRRFPKRPGTRVSRLLLSPTQWSLIARLKVWKGGRCTRDRVVILVLYLHGRGSSRIRRPPLSSLRGPKFLK